MVNMLASVYKPPLVRHGTPPPACVPEGQRCRKCAVVLSSGILRSQNVSRMIDSFNVVFRFNMAPTAGYESAVGARTTYMCLHNKVSHTSHLSPAHRWAAWARAQRQHESVGSALVWDEKFVPKGTDQDLPWLILNPGTPPCTVVRRVRQPRTYIADAHTHTTQRA